MQEMNSVEIDAVAGGPVSTSTVLGAGAAIVGVGAVALAVVASPILAPAVAVYGVTAGVLALGAALAALKE